MLYKKYCGNVVACEIESTLDCCLNGFWECNSWQQPIEQCPFQDFVGSLP